ncbi:AfsR/SARP family transcriptional regulator [Amycolatopsis suaedae]|nr:BTAD domain-containing putative transcriptional regulator [Amycolatopsis suaedae]
MLATLVLHPNVPVSVDVLAEVLWPQSQPRSASANIRTYVHSLRRGGLADRIESRPAGYVLHAEPHEIDATRFELVAQRARAALNDGDPATALALYDEAGGLWRGTVLEDLPPCHVWAASAARLSEMRSLVREHRIDALIQLGRSGEAVIELRGLLAEQPIREALWEKLVDALAAAGRTGEALQACFDAENVLLEELGTSPGEGLRKARARLLGAEPAEEPDPFPVRQLPLDLPDFTGRRGTVDELTTLLRGNGRAVAVLSGPPGVGKTSLAVRVVHQLSPVFPDGQLYLDLRGTSARPRQAGELLPEVLRSLGIPDASMPPTLAERSALLRSQLARRRLCLVLDDAANAAQVRPLLPGAGRSAVLITSRVRLPELVGAASISVDVLPETEATALLTELVGERRVRAEPDTAAEILRGCGYLPLAVRVVGAKLAQRPAWRLRVLADRLRDERRRLRELEVGDLAVRASVALSYDRLDPDAARAFRGLGLLGATRFPAWVVAALLGREYADDVLDQLVDVHLVELTSSDENGQARYRLHDLLRVFATDRGHAEDTGADRRSALRRVIEGYLDLAGTAAERIPIHFFGTHDVRTDGWRVRQPESLVADPTAWFEAERITATTLVELAARWELDDLAWRLATAFIPFFDLRGHQDDWERTHVIALAAARRRGCPRGQAIVQRNLGQVQLYRDAYPEALAAFEESRMLFEREGDRRGVAIGHSGLGTVHRILGDNDSALEHCERALRLFGEVGDRHGQAVATIALGSVRLSSGDLAEAERCFAEARSLSVAIGDRHREAHALMRMALVRQAHGELSTARDLITTSIAIFDDLGDHHCVGYANQRLGEVCLDSGDLAHARLLLVNSVRMHRRNGDRRSEAEVSELLGRLHQTLGENERSHGYFTRARALRAELPA